MDATITISAIVSLLTFIFLHFVIEPRKRKRLRLEESYKNFYAPLYSIVVQRVGVAKSMQGKKDKLQLGRILENKKPIEFLEDDYMFKFIIDNSSFASVDILDEFFQYASLRFKLGSERKSENFIKILTKEHANLRKSLGLDYDEQELKTGIPKLHVPR